MGSNEENLATTLNQLNKLFHNDNRVKDTERSLFFSGLLIALSDHNFRSIYKNIQAPMNQGHTTVLESSRLNEYILDAISIQLEGKTNNASKVYSWKDRFSFIKNVDYPLQEYIALISKIENEIFIPFKNKEQKDILGKAYTIFLKRAGKIDNKNIILTPEHITSLMVELSNLHQDDVVLDTCTGTGGFLMESMRVLLSKAKGDKKKIDCIKKNQLIGFESDPVLFALACSNMFLHGDGRSNLIYGSSLAQD